MKVMCIVSDGFEELEAVGTIALFRRAGIEIDIYALNKDHATGRFQLSLHELKNLCDADIKTYDALFLPGGPHYQTLEADEHVCEIIHFFMKEHKIVAAICAAPTILGKLGLLKGKKYTCFTSMNEDFGGTYIDEYYVVDDHLVTGRSAAASIEFAFAFMEKLAGKEVSDRVKKEIYY